ncbi:uncharacterized protein IUM83_04494 [Phytophthora cinnamomi]|uniref:uncharacterized protein n=1 Tax=Phytophthora cinnamomi TaxID=4785 RepID=UPI00355A232B|nr:hypothetical protein IUM83_04494 [Phytophthora cinnamomi]
MYFHVGRQVVERIGSVESTRWEIELQLWSSQERVQDGPPPRCSCQPPGRLSSPTSPTPRADAAAPRPGTPDSTDSTETMELNLRLPLEFSWMDEERPPFVPGPIPPVSRMYNVGEFTGLTLGADTSLESALTVLSTNCDALWSDGSNNDGAAARATLVAAAARASLTAVKALVVRVGDSARHRFIFLGRLPTEDGVLYLRVKIKQMKSSLVEIKNKEARKRSPRSELTYKGKPSSEGAGVWGSLANIMSTLEKKIKPVECRQDPRGPARRRRKCCFCVL